MRTDKLALATGTALILTERSHHGAWRRPQGLRRAAMPAENVDQDANALDAQTAKGFRSLHPACCVLHCEPPPSGNMTL
ncbi:hypothetical protein ACFYN9_07485 [Streptomyces collinus]|nr:hypothetical protein [Streptomyces collinus]WMX68834.1 hypothetical protein RFN52_38095 [Streptomyces collinus]